MTIEEKLARTDKLKSWLDDFRPLPVAIVRELKKLYDVRFTYHSNAIEGNTLTQSETEMVLEKGLTIGGKSLIEHLEVIGHKEAIDYVESLARQQTAITEREIKDIHSIIMQGIEREEAGRYRRMDVRAAGTEHVYPAHLVLQDLMEEFVRWLNSSAAEQIHPIELASQVHYRFVAIHPFRDGNGRTGRLLMNLVLLRRGYPITVISNQRRKEYIDSLVYAQSTGDDIVLLRELVADAVTDSLIEILRVLATAEDSMANRKPFYAEMLTALQPSN